MDTKRENMLSNSATKELVLGGGSVWGMLKITSWADLSYALAAVYTAILLCHWTWRHVVFPHTKRGKAEAERRRRERDDD
jgi:hypothetical protein